MAKTIELRHAAELLRINDNVKLVYPASKTNKPQGRIGVVREISAKMVKVEVPPHAGGGYRTFMFSRIIGDIQVT